MELCTYSAPRQRDIQAQPTQMPAHQQHQAPGGEHHCSTSEDCSCPEPGGRPHAGFDVSPMIIVMAATMLITWAATKGTASKSPPGGPPTRLRIPPPPRHDPGWGDMYGQHE